jgi:hypothetical protein
MTQTSTSTDGAMPFFQPLMEFWAKSLEQNTELASTLMNGAREATDVASLRSRWLDALRESLDAFMRQPAFLEAMRRNFLVMSEHKSRGEDLAQEMARETGLPRLPDISGLFERIQTGQKTIRARLSSIEQRLDNLECQVHNPGAEVAAGEQEAQPSLVGKNRNPAKRRTNHG